MFFYFIYLVDDDFVKNLLKLYKTNESDAASAIPMTNVTQNGSTSLLDITNNGRQEVLNPKSGQDSLPNKTKKKSAAKKAIKETKNVKKACGKLYDIDQMDFEAITPGDPDFAHGLLNNFYTKGHNYRDEDALADLSNTDSDIKVEEDLIYNNNKKTKKPNSNI